MGCRVRQICAGVILFALAVVCLAMIDKLPQVDGLDAFASVSCFFLMIVLIMSSAALLSGILPCE